MRRLQYLKALFAAMAAVLVFASPAAAAEQSTTTVEAVPASVTVGDSVDLIATVTCPGGDPGPGLGVTFFDGAELLDSVRVGADGRATLPASFETPGTHNITAAYNGNADCFASSDETTVSVSDAPPPPVAPALICNTCGNTVNIYQGDIHNG